MNRNRAEFKKARVQGYCLIKKTQKRKDQVQSPHRAVPVSVDLAEVVTVISTLAGG
jgi:hypothetical protein